MGWSKVGNLRGPGALIDLGLVTIAETAVTAIPAGIRKITLAIPGLVAGDVVVISPRAANFPNGYLVGQPIARADGVLDVLVSAPALSINASYTFKARIVAMRLRV